MDIFSGSQIASLADKQKRLFQGLLPELVKKLILNSSSNVEHIRIPGKDDVWAPGFDGIVENSQAGKYVCGGTSVWEFGTNSDSLRKINDDYQKRTVTPLGVDKSKTELYLVIPYIWAYDNQGYSITKWESEHKADWKKVHVFDAVVLADWVNSEPAVCAWLMEQIGQEKDIDFSSISSAWTRFASKTSPSFSHSLFLEGRDVEKTFFFENWNESIIRIKADTTIDAYGFCLSSILEQNDKANSVIVIYNQTTYKELSRFCKGKIFLLNFYLDCDVIEGNRIILCYNKEARTICANVELRQLSKSIFDKAIKDMGVPDGQANSLYGQTHGNLLSLIRKIPGTSTDSCPKWANQDRIGLLAPILLLRDFDTKNECDRNLMSYLADERYEILFEKYNAWLHLEDAPIKLVADHIVLINFEEAWDVLRLSPSSPIFDRFVDVIGKIISYNGVKQDDEPNIVDSKSKRHLYSLYLDIIYFANVTGEDDTVEKVVKTLLERKPFSNLLLKHISLLAEAVPTVVMDFLQVDIKKENGIIAQSFREDHYSHDYCNILSALEELVIHEETRICACDLLFDLYLKTCNRHFNISNSPKESLLNALCLWNDHTILTVEEKENLIKKYLSIDEGNATLLATDLLLKNSITYGVRDGAKASPKMEIGYEELFKTINNIASILFNHYIKWHNIEGLKKLLQGYRHFYLDTLIDASKLFNSSEYSLSELIPLNYELRKSAFYAGQNENTNPWIPSLVAWIEVTTPSDDVGSLGWMFYDYYSYFFLEEQNNKDGWKDRAGKIAKRRAEVLDTLVQTHSIEEIIRLAQCSKDEVPMGAFYARHFTTELFFAFAEEVHRLNKIGLLCGLLDGAERKDCITVLDILSPKEQQIVLSNLYRHDILDWLDTPEKEHFYWMHQNMQEYDDYIYNKLLIHNPHQLLSFFAYIQSPPLSINIEKIIETFKAILSSTIINPNNHNSYDIDEIIAKVDQEGYESDEWAQLCSQLYDHDWLQTYPNILKKFYFANPYLLCDKIIDLNGNSYSQFSFHYELPENAYCDYEAFSFFVKTFIERHTDKDLLLSIGSILGKVRDGADGIFPHEYVRMEMEKYKYLSLNREVLIGKLNSTGVRSIGDGSFEKECAVKYRNDAKKFDLDFPETAQLLRWLSDDYASEGKRDQLFSEIGTSAW